MQILDIALAEQIEITPDRTLVASRPIYTISPPALPYTKPNCMMGIAVTITEDDVARRIVAQFIVTAPDGKRDYGPVVADLARMIMIPDEAARHGAVVAGCAVEFHMLGIYELAVFIDGKKAKAVNFEVVSP
jgi:hypothetical protein